MLKHIRMLPGNEFDEAQIKAYLINIKLALEMFPVIGEFKAITQMVDGI